MNTNGMAGLYLETHNWGRTVKFWQQLGYELEFETDHHSGQLRHPSGGPYLFVAERASDAELQTYPLLATEDAASFEPPAAGSVAQPFKPEHWGVMEALLTDPDGRTVSVHAPLPAGEPAATA
jgi:hypothetical protein